MNILFFKAFKNDERSGQTDPKSLKRSLKSDLSNKRNLISCGNVYYESKISAFWPSSWSFVGVKRLIFGVLVCAFHSNQSYNCDFSFTSSDSDTISFKAEY